MSETVALESDPEFNRQYFQMLMSGARDVFAAQVITGIICAAVVCSVVLALCGSVVELKHFMQAIEPLGMAFCGVVFLAEWILRCWAAPADNTLNKRFVLGGRRGDYVCSFLGIVDALVCLPALLVVSGVLHMKDGVITAGWVAIVGVCALFKLARYVEGLELVGAVLRIEWPKLRSALLTLCVLVVLTSSLLFMVEQPAQPEVFKSIPHTMWWGIVTMTTTGYGDMAPVTLVGRVIGGIGMLLGIAMLAMPCGIIASGFANEIKRRELLENWRIVSRLPLFAGLDAGSVAEIAGMLKPQIIPAHSRVITKGGFADAMFFIVEGEVEVVVAPTPVRLGPGAFFGETGLLRRAQRNADVNTLKQTRFLVLGLTDFHALVERQPAIGEQIAAVAERRSR
jgi:voltage-gated potassium channel